MDGYCFSRLLIQLRAALCWRCGWSAVVLINSEEYLHLRSLDSVVFEALH